MMSTDSEVNAGGKPVVTIWETFGSNMDAIGHRVAELLGLPFHETGVSSAQISSAARGEVDDNALDRLLRHLAEPRRTSTWFFELSIEDQLKLRDMVTENNRQVLRVAAEGGVLLGRNGVYLLRDMPNVLHVLLDGPVADRVHNAALHFDISDEAAGAMQQLEDALRVDLSKYLYGYCPDELKHYDIVVNTARLSGEDAAQLVAHAAQALTTARLVR